MGSRCQFGLPRGRAGRAARQGRPPAQRHGRAPVLHPADSQVVLRHDVRDSNAHPALEAFQRAYPEQFARAKADLGQR